MRELAASLVALCRTLPDLPDYVAWRLDTFTYRVRDRKMLVPPVWDAWNGVK
jgi:hypothetical protein